MHPLSCDTRPQVNGKSKFHDLKVRFENQLDYALFFDQRLDIKNISDLYLHVLRSLFELNPEVFFSLEIKEKIGLTSQKETLREARPIGDTYFVEINHDSKNKFDRIKILLRAMDLTDELFIKYKQ